MIIATSPQLRALASRATLFSDLSELPYPCLSVTNLLFRARYDALAQRTLSFTLDTPKVSAVHTGIKKCVTDDGMEALSSSTASQCSNHWAMIARLHLWGQSRSLERLVRASRASFLHSSLVHAS